MSTQTKKLLQSHNIKSTAAREMIFDILSRSKSPLNYEQIKAQMKLKTDKATFYRNIALFEAAHLVQKFEGDERKWYFELSRKAHAHFVCEGCHSVICVDFEMGGNWEHEVKNVILKGFCKDCR